MAQNENKQGPLMNLSNDIKNLVNDGVYAVYTLSNEADASYVLVMEERKTFLLHEDGAILKEGPNLESLNLGHSITFPSAPRKVSFRANAI